MTPNQFRQAQAALIRPLIIALMRLLGLVSGKPLSDEQKADLAAAFADVVNPARRSASNNAWALYTELRPEDAEAVNQPRLIDVPAEYFAKVLDTFLEDLESERPEGAQSRITQSAIRMVENAARGTTIAASTYDNAAVAWARVLTGAESCGWCAMLASRGPVYRSRKSAGEGDKWHLGCDCLVVPVFRGQEKHWPGYEEYIRLEQLWAESVKGARGKKALKNFAQALAEEDIKEYSPLPRV